METLTAQDQSYRAASAPPATARRRAVRILGTGKHQPERVVRAEELDELFGLEPGTIGRKSGVHQRRFAGPGDTTAGMGAAAARQALAAAGLRASDVDLIVCASSLPQQPLPCTAALIQRELGLERSGVACFDVNMTCLSFVVALDMLSHAIHAGAYRRVLLVASEITSQVINWQHVESASLLSDGAAAVVLGPAEGEEGILGARFETYATGAEDCAIRGGGTQQHASSFTPEQREDFLFRMDGPAVFRLALTAVDPFMRALYEQAGVTPEELALLIPHQASGTALALLRRKLGFSHDRWMDILADHGNCAAASIPMALHDALASGRARRGDLVALCGTSAGFSIGGVVIRL